MDEKVKNDEKKVMLVRQTGEGQDGKLKAVGSIVSIRFTTYFLEVFENIWDKIWRN